MVMSTLLDGSKSMSEKPKKKQRWMKSAVPESHRGAFTEKAKKAGEFVHSYAEKEKHNGGKIGKEANLAMTFEKEGHKKKHKDADSLMKSMYGHKMKKGK